MANTTHFDVIIVGGSYSGLAAGMALGRSLRTVLIIDSGHPCNRQTPHSHNFLTHDGHTPQAIAAAAREQVERYETVHFLNDFAETGSTTATGFTITTAGGRHFSAQKLLFASGIRDLLPPVEGFAECWGISLLHCPYCHGYEVRHETTGVLANGDVGFEFTQLISNWTNDLTLFTNGPSALTSQQREQLEQHAIRIVETPVSKLVHSNGYLQAIALADGSFHAAKALYTHHPFEQHCSIPEQLGCEFTEEGFIRVDGMQKTSVSGVYASGDCTTRLRTVSYAVSTGSISGMLINKELVVERF